MTELDKLFEVKQFDQDILKELNMEYEKYKKIIDSLNILVKIIDEEFS